ncbi:hypothetical protein WJX81_006235 [Elliptochloris bilobata]|uniref:F-box domain-containing protein n=1 Tax=Elliptochloris bilobata TaxID=381761 RepID=A0AAW1SKZ5_9CHLO
MQSVSEGYGGLEDLPVEVLQEIALKTSSLHNHAMCPCEAFRLPLVSRRFKQALEQPYWKCVGQGLTYPMFRALRESPDAKSKQTLLCSEVVAYPGSRITFRELQHSWEDDDCFDWAGPDLPRAGLPTDLRCAQWSLAQTSRLALHVILRSGRETSHIEEFGEWDGD